MSIDTATITADLAEVSAAGAVFAPLAGPDAVLAEQVLTQGLAFWAAYQAKKAAGTLTLFDVEQAAMKTGTDLAQLAADIKAQAGA